MTPVSASATAERAAASRARARAVERVAAAAHAVRAAAGEPSERDASLASIVPTAAEDARLRDGITFGLGAWAVVFGVLTAAGGRKRWLLGLHRTALELPGAPQSWAAVIAVAGLMVAASVFVRWQWLAVAGNALAFAWCLAYEGAVVRETLRDPDTAFDLATMCALLSYAFGFRAVFFWRRMRRRRGRSAAESAWRSASAEAERAASRAERRYR